MKMIALVLMASVVALALALAAPWGGGGDGPGGVGPGIALGLAAEAAAALDNPESTFPADRAGLAAYVQTDTPLDLKDAAEAFAGLAYQGGNWVIGVVPVNIFPEWGIHTTKTVDVEVYVDTDGWAVAYLSRDGSNRFASYLMVWTGISSENPQLDAITTTSLEEALDKVLAAAGVNFAPLRKQVGYYHFGFPEANRIVLAASAGKGWIDTYFDITIAQGSEFYETSISAIAEETNASIDGTRWHSAGAPPHYLSVLSTPRDLHRHADPRFVPGPAHTFGMRVRDFPENEAGGVAVVVVYGTP